MGERRKDDEDVKKLATKCPICKKSGVHKFRPFCSKRCADIDLGRWFNEDYSVPAVEAPDEWDLPGSPGEGVEESTGEGEAEGAGEGEDEERGGLLH